ncbi:MAG: ferrous iron transport protein B [Parachlamydiales bacterium]|nr:ferrous iron transport protein B [Parachlamydiales bacterium]
MTDLIKIALIGNPNCGKTTLFNAITGFRQKIGNYPGVTVEKKCGIKKIGDITLEIIDLPGIYSLGAHSDDERVAKNYILEEKPDIVINIIDASNLEKSLFLTTELMELDRPILLAMNMTDIVKRNDIEIDYEFLKSILEVEIVEIIANKKIGLDLLLEKAINLSKKEKSRGINVKFSSDVESAILEIEKKISDSHSLKEKRLLALKFLENDKDFFLKYGTHSLKKIVEIQKEKIEKKYLDHFDMIIQRQRHEFLREILKKTIFRKEQFEKTFSDKIDSIVTNKYLGLPLFLLIMFLIFEFTFSLGAYPTILLEKIFKGLSSFLMNIWPKNSFLLIRSLLIDGVIAGVGSVLSFLPNIMILFFSISILEDSGYMARAAFILDRIMHKLDLHGKSFIPMLIGFGCSVPAIMATRFLENKKDRLITILAIPLIACSAKLVVFTLIIPAFFEKAYQPIVLFSLYLIGIILAIISIKLFKLTLFKKESFSFVMELPEYKLPSFFALFMHMWDRSKEYIKKAGTLILGFSIVLWFLSTFPMHNDKKDISKSYVAKIGNFIEPVFKPLGFDWKINTSLISSFAAKEVFVSQLSVIYATKDSDRGYFQKELRKDYSKLQAYAIMLFILISTPCMATIAITKKELNSFKWALFQLFYLTALAYAVTLIFYQLGKLFTG